MQKFAEWLTARPARGLFAASLASLLTLVALPLAAWLPAAVMVLALLAGGPRTAALAGLGAALPIVWGYSPLLGASGALILVAAVLGPAYLAGSLLNRSRSLSLVFQVVALSAAGLVLLAHLLLGNPASVLAQM